MRDLEHNEQKALVKWARLMPPPVCWLFAIPNGGGRSKAEAGRMRAEGVLRGVPDLLLPVARGGYHALYIEMKSPTGRLSAPQREMIAILRGQGFAVEVCRSWVEGKDVIERYMAPSPLERLESEYGYAETGRDDDTSA